MKEEDRRYFLVEYYAIGRRIEVDTLDKVKEVLKETRNYNNRKYSKFLYGNVLISISNNKYIITSHLYRKYTDRMRISDIDNFTSKYDEDEIAMIFKSKSKMKDGLAPDINIAYFETSNYPNKDGIKYEIGVKYIPVLYKEDLKYMDINYIKNCLYFHAQIKDYDFFKDLVLKFDPYQFINDEKDNLLETIEKCRINNLDLMCLYIAAEKLYSKFICEYEKDESLTRLKNGEYQISRRRLRDFGFFVKNYNLRKAKINSPLIYNKNIEGNYLIEDNGQIKLK